MRKYTLGEFRQNNGRVSNLIAIYEAAQANLGRGRRDAQSADTLRAAVVFLHSALEEVFRNLFLWKLPSGTRESLNAIPLIGLPTHQRAKPFLLGDLIPYRGLFVENVMRESIGAYVDSMNLNGIPDICQSLSMIGVDHQQFEIYYADLSACMARRHQIVHQMDRNHETGTGNSRVQSISTARVRAWQQNTHNFVHSLVGAIPD